MCVFFSKVNSCLVVAYFFSCMAFMWKAMCCIKFWGRNSGHKVAVYFGSHREGDLRCLVSPQPLGPLIVYNDIKTAIFLSVVSSLETKSSYSFYSIIICVINKRLQIFSIKKADAKTGFMRHQITGRYAGDPCTFTQMPREFGPSPAEHWAFRKIADVGPKTSVSRNMLSFCVQSWGLYVYVYTKRYVCVYVFIYFPLGIFTSSIDRISFTDVIIPAKPEILKHFVSGPLCAPKNVWELERALVYVGFIKWYLLHQELKLVNFKVFIKLLQSDNNTFITC